jgi:hypothetical protein
MTAKTDNTGVNSRFIRLCTIMGLLQKCNQQKPFYYGHFLLGLNFSFIPPPSGRIAPVAAGAFAPAQSSCRVCRGFAKSETVLMMEVLHAT